MLTGRDLCRNSTVKNDGLVYSAQRDIMEREDLRKVEEAKKDKKRDTSNKRPRMK